MLAEVLELARAWVADRTSRWATRRRAAVLLCATVAAIGHAAPGGAQQSARAVISSLPVISYEAQCRDGGDCDYSVQDDVFVTLDSLGASILERGLSTEEVTGRWGPPPDVYLAPLDFRDVRFGNRVTIWTYAVSLSGTSHYVLVFANGCLDYFGFAQAGELYARYGRPEWTSDVVDDYRFRSPPGSACGAS